MRAFFLFAMGLAACAPPTIEESTGVVRSELVATDPVSTAVSSSCTTSAVVGLSTQLVDEIQCLRPGTLKRIDGVSGLSLGSAVFPYLQVPAADAVFAAQKARGATLTINSALRTLPQQFLLYSWYRAGRCGIGLAAAPGKSNHEAGLALDVADNASWRSAMEAQKMRWFGTGDPVHFDFVGAGGVELRGLSVLAFQRLWNRNHPEDKIAEDSDYGSATEQRLAKAPVGGFAKGADCTQPKPNVDAGAPADLPPVPDTPEPGTADAPPQDGSSGCATSTSRPASAALALLLALLVTAACARRSRGGAGTSRDPRSS